MTSDTAPLLRRLALGLLLVPLLAVPAQAFCGFFVARGDAKLFNEASRVVLVRDRDRTVLTMVNDFQGEARDFAMVVPAPTVLQREQIHVTETPIIDHLDAYTAPRLVEYHDEDPCRPQPRVMMMPMAAGAPPAPVPDSAMAEDLGVTVEAEYTVGEYDIKILSATESDGLATWLTRNGYTIPDGAGPILGSYIAQDLKFFVAKVNVKEHAAAGGGMLRPLQIAYESKKFMLPIRLGTVNARGSQDLLLYTLTRTGRVETVNYRTVRMPTDTEIPVAYRPRFDDVYKSIFAEAVDREGGAAVMLEYAWDMGWCDPCAADPLSVRDLRELGVFWLDDSGGPARDVFVTRLHARYDAVRFPEDLRLMETGDRSNFQGRYVVRHPWTGRATCEAGRAYRAALPARFEEEAQTLANLTGWDIAEIRAEMAKAGTAPKADDTPWWKTLWRD